jgi:cysteine synthase
VNIFVVGVGTGVTIIGVSQYLKEQNQAVQIVVVEPRDSTTLSGGRAGVHKIQDIGAGYVPEVLDASVYDEIILVGKAFLHCHIAHQLINAAVQDIGQQRQNRNIRHRTSIFPLGNSLKGYPYLFS